MYIDLRPPAPTTPKTKASQPQSQSQSQEPTTPTHLFKSGTQSSPIPTHHINQSTHHPLFPSSFITTIQSSPICIIHPSISPSIHPKAETNPNQTKQNKLNCNTPPPPPYRIASPRLASHRIPQKQSSNTCTRFYGGHNIGAACLRYLYPTVYCSL
ncbi:hypothetical protein EYC84_001224 [Monilinia fructicola]|uniref:Uncharacterized protein n=1 Tax=Monilinia fructicola TaxID=38448 RepID=A0A5M9JRQ2_MONFR|nr:hypothetical protein EYC84_001224 [Monilinia fructicola]